MYRCCKFYVYVCSILFCSIRIVAQDKICNPLSKSLWGGLPAHNHLTLSLQLQTKYVWRGMEMIPKESFPVLFPSLTFINKGFSAYAMGGYSLNGGYAEIDLGLSYTHKWLTLSLNDYYYATTNTRQDTYFNFSNQNTGHWLEGVINISPQKIPAYLTLSNFFYGADKKANGKQAYSTYLELGTFYDFQHNNRLSLALGAACNKSCYNTYEANFTLCNIEIKYTHTLHMRNESKIPLSFAYILNPKREKSFVNFSSTITF